MKALVTEFAYNGFDELRQATGGAGYLSSSGFADWFQETAAFPTFEGVNNVMYQQSARLLLKNASDVAKGKAPHPFFAYLGKMQELLSTKSGATSVEQFLNPDHLERALATRSAMAVKTLATKLA